jgi:hypothetical protein
MPKSVLPQLLAKLTLTGTNNQYFIAVPVFGRFAAVVLFPIPY